jgi:hypothetical protein
MELIVKYSWTKMLYSITCLFLKLKWTIRNGGTKNNIGLVTAFCLERSISSSDQPLDQSAYNAIGLGRYDTA